MGADVESSLTYGAVETRLVAAGLITATEAIDWRSPLRFTYDQILALHKAQWNGIWFRVVRNFFWSATAGHFDIVVGNPPWVRWSKLPEAYRERVKPTCERYGIFSKTKRHGGNELDISAMITYTTADKWLKAHGRLAFLITGSVFKNPSSTGFRAFVLQPFTEESLHLSPISVDDMKAIKPFEDASNHTTIAIFEKAVLPGKYPVLYRMWEPTAGSTRAVPATSSLQEVLMRVTISSMEAAPVGGIGSPWAVLPHGRYSVLSALAGTCTWASGRKGITTDLNGVYFVPVVNQSATRVQVRSRPEAGKTKMGPSRVAWIEADILYPLIKGAGDFEACYLRLNAPTATEERLFALVPNTGILSVDYNSAEAKVNSSSMAGTRAWFAQYKSLLSERSTYRRQMAGAPYYAIYNVGDYTFKPWKVIWPEMSTRFFAAVAGSAHVPIMGLRPYVPDHKVYFAAFDDKAPALFLCGLLNSPTVAEWIESHNISIQVGDIFKHLRLQEYDDTNIAHVNLAKHVEAAHDEHNTSKRQHLVARIRADAEALLGQWMKQPVTAGSRH